MSRIPDPGFDTRIADWLEADPNLAPPDLLRTVESALPSIPQRRVMHLPWRFPSMSTFAKVAVAAVAVIAIGAVGMIALQPRGVPSVGSPPSASPSASPSPSPSPSPASPSPSMPPPLSETFTSPDNDVSIAYPAGWSTQPATEPWTTTVWPSYLMPTGDFLYDERREANLFIALASQPLSGMAADEWVAAVMSADGGCAVTEPVTIDGATGQVGTLDCNRAAVVLDGRGYLVLLYTSDDEAWLSEAYDGVWFEQLLATVDLQPEAPASAAPSP
jgi:hypothetical protein